MARPSARRGRSRVPLSRMGSGRPWAHGALRSARAPSVPPPEFPADLGWALVGGADGSPSVLQDREKAGVESGSSAWRRCRSRKCPDRKCPAGSALTGSTRTGSAPCVHGRPEPSPAEWHTRVELPPSALPRPLFRQAPCRLSRAFRALGGGAARATQPRKGPPGGAGLSCGPAELWRGAACCGRACSGDGQLWPRSCSDGFWNVLARPSLAERR